ncbi:MAG: M81 family metallopeptidase [Steroidobacteraceae bacterium]
MKVFLAGLITETNTFSNIPTSRASFESTGLAQGRDDALNHPLFGALLAPVEKSCRELGIDTEYGLFGFAQPSGPMTQTEYEALRDELLAGVRRAGSVDAVLLCLHGAMAAHETWDCEGDILSRVRQIVGTATPVVAVLDPHAHLTEQMVASASVMAFMKEYPHTDGPDRMLDMLNVVRRMWDGSLRPAAAVIDCNVLGFWPTQAEPIRSLTDLFYRAEQRGGVVSASFVHGFPWGDTPETGSKVLVYTCDDRDLAHRVAQELAGAVTSLREASRVQTTPIEAALDAVAHAAGLVVLADFGDNPGGGAPADSTFILRRALDRGMSQLAFGLFHDPELVRFCFAAGIGGRVEGRLGGKTSRFSGAPLDFVGTVRGLQRDAIQIFGRLHDRMGDAAWLRLAGIDVVVTSLRTQCFDPSAFDAVGLEIRGHRGVVVKSSNHFQAGFAPLACRTIIVATPGALSTDFARLPYQRLCKPRWPRAALCGPAESGNS